MISFLLAGLLCLSKAAQAQPAIGDFPLRIIEIPESPSQDTAAAERFGELQVLPDDPETKDEPPYASNRSDSRLSAPGKPLIIGHRGDGAKSCPEPENTLAALQKGFETGMDAVEFDVQLSKDGELVLVHNVDVNKMTLEKGCVGRFTKEQLESMSLVDGTGRVSREHMTDLNQALLLLQREQNRNPRKLLGVIHLKVYDGLHGDWPGIKRFSDPCPKTDHDQLARKALAQVLQAGLRDQVLFISFDHRVLDIIRSSEPQAQTGLLSFLPDKATTTAARRHYTAVLPEFKKLRREDLIRAHDLGLRVFVWSVTKIKDFKRFSLSTGKVGLVDGIISNSLSAASL